MSARFAWGAMLRVALRDLRLSPEAFWALTPAEFLILTGLDQGGGAMTRSQLDLLSRRFPDTSTSETP
ncbi:MAG: phage tail assembly chaperone [Pseudomonadota bacterium]